MLHAGEYSRLVKTAELYVRRDTRSDVEDVGSDVGASRDWEQWIVDDASVQGGFDDCLCEIAVSLNIS